MTVDELRRACAARWATLDITNKSDVESPANKARVDALRKVQGKADRLPPHAAKEDIDELAAALAAVK